MPPPSPPSLLMRIIGLILVIVGVMVMLLSGSCASLSLMMIPAMEHGMGSEMLVVAAWSAVAGGVGLGVFLLGRRLRGSPALAKSDALPKSQGPQPPE